MSQLEIRVGDQHGAVVPARVSVTARSDGQPVWPTSEHLRYDIVEPWGAERSFVSEGPARLEVAPGEYDIRASRGPESRSWRSSCVVEPEHDLAIDAIVERWCDMPRRGWFSGDIHVHRAAAEVPLLMRAEGLDVASSIVGHIDLDGADGWQQSGAMDTEADRDQEPGDAEVERIMGGPGALLGLGMHALPNLRTQLWEPFDDVIADTFRAAGGHVDGEKACWPSIPVLALLGKLDSIELACNHFGATWTQLDLAGAGAYAPDAGTASPRALADWILELYGALLDCGLRLPVSGGSGAGVMPNPLGASRTYVQLDGPVDRAAWLEAIRRGRSFSTNGPMLELEVDGHLPGDTVDLRDRRRLPVRLRASTAVSLGEVSLVVNGRIVGQLQPSADHAGPFEAEIEIDASHGGWVAARGFEQRDDAAAIGFAQTSPVWLDGPPDAEVRRGGCATVGRWLDWTEQRMKHAEREIGRPLDGARRGIDQARDSIAARASVSGRR